MDMRRDRGFKRGFTATQSRNSRIAELRKRRSESLTSRRFRLASPNQVVVSIKELESALQVLGNPESIGRRGPHLIAALKVLRHALSVPSPPRAAIYSAGVISALSLLIHGPSDEVTQEALWVIVNLSAGDVSGGSEGEAPKLMCENMDFVECVDALLGHLTAGTCVVKDLALWAMANLATREKCRSALIDNGAINALAAHLMVPDGYHPKNPFRTPRVPVATPTSSSPAFAAFQASSPSAARSSSNTSPFGSTNTSPTSSSATEPVEVVSRSWIPSILHRGLFLFVALLQGEAQRLESRLEPFCSSAIPEALVVSVLPTFVNAFAPLFHAYTNSLPLDGDASSRAAPVPTPETDALTDAVYAVAFLTAKNTTGITSRLVQWGVVELLVKCLSSPFHDIVSGSLHALTNILAADPEHAPAAMYQSEPFSELLRLLRHPHRGVRKAATHVTGRFASSCPPALHAFSGNSGMIGALANIMCVDLYDLKVEAALAIMALSGPNGENVHVFVPVGTPGVVQSFLELLQTDDGYLKNLSLEFLHMALDHAPHTDDILIELDAWETLDNLQYCDFPDVAGRARFLCERKYQEEDQFF